MGQQQADSGGQDWWQAVKKIAGLMCRDGIGTDEAHLLRQELAQCGFSREGIGKALEWMETASLSGVLNEALGMLQPASEFPRIEHPLERGSVCEELAQAIFTCKRRGLFSQEMAERLIEAIRSVETRDWEYQEVVNFLEEIFEVACPGLSGHPVSLILNGRVRDQYH